ncbi:DUF4189 domain-containing protein [Nocardia sp. NPDC058379]|uniref:DUF4189 domain-containing protein n=1 Tax=unclassified Nocardia TaxID=2637762 RepID=UPI00364C7866
MRYKFALIVHSAVIAAAGAGMAITAAPAGASADRWASIAISPSTGHHGYAADFDSQAGAEATAVEECGESDCFAYVDASSGWCIAAAHTSSGQWSWARATNRTSTEGMALASLGGDAVVARWVCQT